MIHKKLNLFLIGFFLSSTTLLAQTTFNVTSQSSTINGLYHEYSVGELTLVETQKTASLFVTQGFLQPPFLKNEIFNSNNNEGIKHFEDKIKIYPNPLSTILNIDMIEITSANCILYDALGNIVLNQNLLQQKNNIDLSYLATGNYYIIINPNNSTEKLTFKIQKK